MTNQNKRYDEAGVLRDLQKKQDFLGADSITGEAYVRYAGRNTKCVNDLGNKSQGKLDFLKSTGWVIRLVVDDEDYRKVMAARYKSKEGGRRG